MTTTLRKALERLSAAALARDSTMGDPCALLAAKAELADANKAACAALAAPQPEPVAWVPVHPRSGPLWAMTTDKPDAERLPSYPLMPVYAAAPPAAPAPGDMVMVPLKFVQDFNTLAHNYCLRAVPPDYYSGTEADAFQHAYSRCGSDLRRLREILAAAPAPAVPDGAVPLGSWEHLKVLMQHSAWEGALQLSDALANIDDFAKSAAPAVPDLKHKPTVQRLMDLARKFRATPGDLYDGAYKELQQACYEALSAAPAVREPQDERIRWRDAVIKEAESALRTAEQEFADMPTWANVGHAAKKVTHALAVIAALGIGGGGK